ncbi:MAG: hypothetical protein CME62_06540 [Halobacteriovoraceae bacterium]|nr:hypothetical protein [Halobacteriovoraceae bacterium]|tara:strand:+ start:23105 stop:24844 length:1740 start_codon:yes stop_codon:yes gene_type:complete
MGNKIRKALFIILSVLTFSAAYSQEGLQQAADSALKSVLASDYKVNNYNLIHGTFNYNDRTYNLSDFPNYIPFIFESKRLNNSQRKLILSDYIRKNKDYLRSKKKFNRKFCRNKNSQKCREALAKKAEVTRSLEIALTLIDDQTHFVPYCRNLAEEIWPEANDLLESLSEVSTAQNCNELSPGSKRLMQDSRSEFLLEREENGDYVATLNLDFYTESTDSNLQNLPASLRARTNECLSLVNNYMTGPDGSKLKIKVLDPRSAESSISDDYRPSVSRIEALAGGNGFADTANIGIESGCGTILHELLHHLGLHDEYYDGHTQSDGTQWGRCRVVSQQDSIMNNAFMLHQVIPRKSTCECDQSCQNIINGTDEQIKNIYLGVKAREVLLNYPVFYSFQTGEKNCSFSQYQMVEDIRAMNSPNQSLILKSESETGFLLEERKVMNNGTVFKRDVQCKCQSFWQEGCTQAIERVKNWTATPRRSAFCPSHDGNLYGYQYENYNENLGQEIEPQLNGSSLVFSNEPYLPSLLLPNQFKRVLYGECPGKSGGYNECGDWSYTPQNKTCEVATQCQDPSYFQGTFD